ncbi:hypothetical protein R3P38DRAFT_3360184 [Favolaschia claudopus]|uniref:Uncharacterized protein n=1 Tax=Favolaschia claudopus TaxID=2862362 RepID=A0AAW0AZX2_9AGAR
MTERDALKRSSKCNTWVMRWNAKQRKERRCSTPCAMAEARGACSEVDRGCSYRVKGGGTRAAERTKTLAPPPSLRNRRIKPDLANAKEGRPGILLEIAAALGAWARTKGVSKGPVQMEGLEPQRKQRDTALRCRGRAYEASPHCPPVGEHPKKKFPAKISLRIQIVRFWMSREHDSTSPTEIELNTAISTKRVVRHNGRGDKGGALTVLSSRAVAPRLDVAGRRRVSGVVVEAPRVNVSIGRRKIGVESHSKRRSRRRGRDGVKAANVENGGGAGAKVEIVAWSRADREDGSESARPQRLVDGGRPALNLAWKMEHRVDGAVDKILRGGMKSRTLAKGETGVKKRREWQRRRTARHNGGGVEKRWWRWDAERPRVRWMSEVRARSRCRAGPHRRGDGGRPVLEVARGGGRDDVREGARNAVNGLTHFTSPTPVVPHFLPLPFIPPKVSTQTEEAAFLKRRWWLVAVPTWKMTSEREWKRGRHGLVDDNGVRNDGSGGRIEDSGGVGERGGRRTTFVAGRYGGRGVRRAKKNKPSATQRSGAQSLLLKSELTPSAELKDKVREANVAPHLTTSEMREISAARGNSQMAGYSVEEVVSAESGALGDVEVQEGFWPLEVETVLRS